VKDSDWDLGWDWVKDSDWDLSWDWVKDLARDSDWDLGWGSARDLDWGSARDLGWDWVKGSALAKCQQWAALARWTGQDWNVALVAAVHPMIHPYSLAVQRVLRQSAHRDDSQLPLSRASREPIATPIAAFPSAPAPIAPTKGQ
jgi:hypothetical protein